MQTLANQINSFLQSVSSDFVPLTSMDNFTAENIAENIAVPDRFIISVSDVYTKFSKVNTKQATGSDNIPNWIFRDCAPFLASSVCALFNSSMREGHVQSAWKSANITPLTKVNPPTLLHKHIRPVSPTSELSKIMESFTCQWEMDAIAKEIDPHQYGSIKGSSTVHALV